MQISDLKFALQEPGTFEAETTLEEEANKETGGASGGGEDIAVKPQRHGQLYNCRFEHCEKQFVRLHGKELHENAQGRTCVIRPKRLSAQGHMKSMYFSQYGVETTSRIANRDNKAMVCFFYLVDDSSDSDCAISNSGINKVAMHTVSRE